MRQIAPGTPGARDKKEGVDDFASRISCPVTAFFDGRDPRFEHFPLRVRQIRWIMLSCVHTIQYAFGTLFGHFLIGEIAAIPGLYGTHHIGASTDQA